jgi:hypothetical protein
MGLTPQDWPEFSTWNSLHKLCRTMLRGEREKLAPIIEVENNLLALLRRVTLGEERIEKTHCHSYRTMPRFQKWGVSDWL